MGDVTERMRVKKEDEEEQRDVRKGGGLMARRWIKHGLRKKGKDWSEGGWRRQAGLIHDGRWWAHRWEERGRGVTGAGRGRRRQKVMRKGEKNTGSRGGERKDGERSGCVCAAQKSLTSLIKTCLLSSAVLQMPTPRGKPLSVTSHTHTHTHALANMRVCSLVGVCLRLMRKK